MCNSLTSLRSPRTRNILRSRKRSWLLSALIASLGLASNLAAPCGLYAQDVNNSTTKVFQTNAVENAIGDYNNLSTGVLNFNGPSGAAEWSSNNLTITNAGMVNLVRADLGIIGDVTNTGQFYIAPQGGIVQVDGHFTVSGTNGAVIIQGGGMELIGDLDGTPANFTNNSAALNGTVISAGKYLSADTITNASGGTMTNWGSLEGRVAIVNNGTLTSDASTSILKGNVTNNYILNARGAIEGNLTNTTGQLTTVKGNLAQTGNLTNAGTLDVAEGNLTGTSQLTNTSTITIGNGRTVSAADVKNNTGGSITLGSNSILTGTKLENSASITVGAGGSVSSTSATTGEDLTNKAAGTINFSGATGTANLSSGTGTIVNKGAINLNAGTVLVTGNLTDTGTVAIANGATFKTGSADQTIANAITLAGTSTFDTNGFDATASGNITGSGGLTKSGLGNLTLDGTNTFSGASSINAGQLTLKGESALGDAGALTVGAAGKLKIEDNETIGSLAGAAGSETNLAANLTTGGNNSSTTYSGKIIGTGKLAKNGTGAMTLAGSNANTFSGGVDVNAGTLTASTNEQLGTGTVNVGSDSALEVNVGTTQTVAGVAVLSDGTLKNSGTLTSGTNISNAGLIQNLGASSVINGGVTNEDVNSIIENKGTINGGLTNNGGTVQNDTAASTINGGLTNDVGGVVNNTGSINGGVTNSGNLNSNTVTSVITGGLDNRSDAKLRNQVSGAIVNQAGSAGVPTITVAGDLVGNSTLINKDTAKLHVKDGNFTGITTLTNQSTNAVGVQVDATRTLGANAVTNQIGSTIVNSGTLQSATAINNSGTITNNTGATVTGGINNAYANALVTNNGTVNGGITQNFGTVNSLNANSVINGGVNNSGYVNAQNQISGAIVNSAEHSFTDVTLTHSQTNAAGSVRFGSNPTDPTLNLSAKSDGVSGGASGNGDVTVELVFDAATAGSSYDGNTNTITVNFTGSSATIAEIRTALNDGDAGDVFTASGGNDTDEIDADIDSVATLTGGRDSGTALIRVLADATGSTAQNKSVAIVNDSTITANTAVASVDSTTGDITVRVNGDVGYDDIATAIDDLSGFNAAVAASVGDQNYATTLDTPPVASTLTNGIFNVEGNLVVDNTFTNVGHLNLNNGDLTGITTLTNSGNIVVQDEFRLQASTIDNTTGDIDLGFDSNLEADTINNSSTIDVSRQGDIIADGTITNNASGTMTFGLGGAAANEVSQLYSDSNSIINNGRIDVTNGTLLTTGNVSGSGTIAMGNGTTFRTGNNNQTITNSMTVANSGSMNFDTAGYDATVSGAISGNGQFTKTGTGNLTLSGTNTFAGPAAINGGQMTLEGGSAIADSTAVQLNTGSLKVSSDETIGSLATSAGTQTILDANLTTGGNNTSTTSSGVISGSAGLIKQGTGAMTLNGASANTYSGGTTVSGGTLNAATDEQLGTGNVSVGTGTNLNISDYTTQTVAGLSNQGTVSLGDSSILNTESSHFNNSGTVNVGASASIYDTGTITNSGTVNFSSDTTLSSATNSITNTGTFNLNSGSLLVEGNVAGNGTIAMSDGTMIESGNNNQTIANSMTVANGGSATFHTAANNATISGAVSGNGQFLKSGTGNLTLSGNNTFAGPAVINDGQLTLQGGNAIANSTAVQLNSGSLKVSSAETIGSLATSAGTQTILDATLYTGSNNSSTTSSGVISGSAGLVKQGTGTMTLNGSAANTFGGGTTVSGGTLTAATNQQLGTGNVNVETGASLTTGNGTTQTVSGLNNQGTVSLGDSATLNTGSSHFVNSGTVNVGTSSSIIDTGAISNSGTINFSGGTATLSSGTNAITNTGNINLNAGTVLVKGNLTGNGSINMNNGTTLRSGNADQQIANGIRVNSGSAVIDTNGNNVNLTGTISGVGTLNKVGSGNLTWVGINNGNALVDAGVMITSTQSQVGNIQITNGSGVVFDQNTNGTYSGNVTGNGTLTKTGSGAVTMMGNSAYSGGTNVMGGTLYVGSHGTGQVQSNVNIANGGTLGGGGTIVGNVVSQQGARIAAGNSIGTLNISGNLNGTGSVVENELNGTTSDLINVTGSATISGATLENKFDPTASYTTRMYRALDAAGGVNGRFASVTNTNAPRDFLTSTFYTPTTVNVVLTSLADATLASSTSTSLLSTGQDYLTTIMNQVNGYQFGGLGMVAGDHQHRTQRNVWFKGVGFFNDTNSEGSLPGYSANTGGGIVGIDKVFGENTRLGFAGGYTVTELDMRNAAKANAEMNSARLNLYGAHSFDFVTLSGIGGYAYHDIDSNRNLVGIGTALGNQSQNEASLNFQLTVNPKPDDIQSLLPYVGIQWVHLSQSAYTEHGTPGFDMVIDKANVDSLRPYVGMGYQHRIVTQTGLIAVPYLFTRYSRETIVDSNITNLSINGSNFVVAGVQPSRNIVGLGGGINSQFRQNLDWYLGYNIDLGDRGTNQNAAAGLGFKF